MWKIQIKETFLMQRAKSEFFPKLLLNTAINISPSIQRKVLKFAIICIRMWK